MTDMQKFVSLKENALLKRLFLLLNSVVLTTSVYATNHYVSTEGSAIGFKDKDVEFSQLLVLKLSVGNGQISTARNYTVFKIITDEEYEKQKNADIWLEAEGGNVGSLWLTTTDSRASGKKYVTVKTGNNSSGSAPAGENGWLSYTFDVKVASTYALWSIPRTVSITSSKSSLIIVTSLPSSNATTR